MDRAVSFELYGGAFAPRGHERRKTFRDHEDRRQFLTGCAGYGIAEVPGGDATRLDFLAERMDKLFAS